MEVIRRDSLAGSIRLLFEGGAVAGLSDGQLLDRFLDGRAGAPESAEVAFEALVDRHGPMVLRVCRARLGDEHDAQDAFQATFLILARKAGSIRDRDSASSWLQGVARRVAGCARRASAVRRAKEREAAGRVGLYAPDPAPIDLAPAVREEVGDLPEKYREPLVLCLLDGLTHEEAAARLGWPVGTVKTRVRRAKDQLRTRLTRRGFAPTVGAIAVAMGSKEASAMPAALVRATAKAALEFSKGPGAVASTAAALAQLGLGSLSMTRMKILAIVMSSFGTLAAGANGLARQGPAQQEKQKPAQAAPVAKSEPDRREATVAKVAEAVDDPTSEQLEMARLDLEVLQGKLETLKPLIVQALKSSDSTAELLANARRAKAYEELTVSERMGEEPFEESRDRIEKRLSRKLEVQNDDLKRLRVAFSEASRRLRKEGERIKELEEREAQATSDPNGPSLDDRLDKMRSISIDLELLRMDAERSKERMKAAHRRSQKVGDEIRLLRSTKVADGDASRESHARLQELAELAMHDHKISRADFLEEGQQIVVSERHLRDLAKGLPPAALAEFARSVAVPRPFPEATSPADADTDRRLADVERKLDQILKAMGNQAREPAKK